MLTYIFLAFAAIFNAIMDTLWTHYSISIFKDLNPKWWNPNESWKYVKNWLGWIRFDAWHIAKFGMLGSLIISIVTYKNFNILDFILLPIIWFVFFELFYSFILKNK